MGYAFITNFREWQTWVYITQVGPNKILKNERYIIFANFAIFFVDFDWPIIIILKTSNVLSQNWKYSVVDNKILLILSYSLFNLVRSPI